MADAAPKSKIDAAAEDVAAQKAAGQAAANASPKPVDADKVADAVDGKPEESAKAEAVKEAIEATDAERTSNSATDAGKTSNAATDAEKASAKPMTRKAAAKPARSRSAASKATTPKAKARTASSRKTPAKKAPAKKTASKAGSGTKSTQTNPIKKLKDNIMATAQKSNTTDQAKNMANEVQERAKSAYNKAGEVAGDVNEFSKANLEAMVESGKIFFNGTQEIVRTDMENVKAVAETVTEDARKVASVKSPTELMQLQGEIARRNFDAVVSFGSQRTETIMKLYNDAFAPLSNRMSVAAEKVSKAA